jgi:hypothetical protein
MNRGGWEGLDMSTLWLGMLLGLPHPEVAGWGGIYSHQPNCSRWRRLLAMGAPDSPVRRHVILSLGLGAGRPLESLSLCGTGQSGVTPDSLVPLWPAALTSAAFTVLYSSLSESTVVAEPPKLLGPHAPVLVSKTSDGYACAPDNLTGSVRVSQGP